MASKTFPLIPAPKRKGIIATPLEEYSSASSLSLIAPVTETLAFAKAWISGGGNEPAIQRHASGTFDTTRGQMSRMNQRIASTFGLWRNPAINITWRPDVI